MKKIIMILVTCITWNVFGQSIKITQKRITFNNTGLYNILRDKKAIIKKINGKKWIKIPTGELKFNKRTGFYIYDNYIIRREGGITDCGKCKSKSINFETDSDTEIEDGDDDAFLKPKDEGQFPPDEEIIPITKK